MNTFGYKNNKESEITQKAYLYLGKQNDVNYRILAQDKLKYASEYNKTLDSNDVNRNYDYTTTPIEKIRHTLFLNNATAQEKCINLKSDSDYDEGHNIQYKDILDIVLELWDRNERVENELRQLKYRNELIENELHRLKYRNETIKNQLRELKS